MADGVVADGVVADGVGQGDIFGVFGAAVGDALAADGVIRGGRIGIIRGLIQRHMGSLVYVKKVVRPMVALFPAMG